MRFLKILGFIFGSALFIIGLAGIPEDLETWEGWLAPVVEQINQDMARWIFAIVGLSIIASIMLYPRIEAWWRNKRKPQTPDKPQSVGIYIEDCEDVEMGGNVSYGIDKPIVVKKSKRIKAWLNKAFGQKKNGNR